MTQKTVLCYGDSNTYGYDPRPVWGGRYSANARWCDLLARTADWNVVNCGENGRMIPQEAWALQELKDLLHQNSTAEQLILMLGTNDVLMSGLAPASAIADRMKALLQFLQKHFPHLPILLLPPPAVRISDLSLCNRVQQLAPLYEEAAALYQVSFCDVSRWEIPLAFDGVHFSEEGHRVFAEKLYAVLCSNRDALDETKQNPNGKSAVGQT